MLPQTTSRKDKWWEAKNPNADWESLYKQFPDTDWDKVYSSIPKELLGERDMKGKQEFKAYKSMIMKMLHDKQTSPQIDEMLKSGEPKQTIPQIAGMISDQAVSQFSKNGKELPLEAIIGGALVIGTELVEIGRAGGFFEVSKKNAMPMVEMASKAVIKSGLKKGYIDPVELQEVTNSGLNEEQLAGGLQEATDRGIPTDTNGPVAMEQYAIQREKQAMARQQPPQGALQEQGGM